MTAYRSFMTSRHFAEARAREMTLRPDMQRQFEEEGWALPDGPIWTLLRGEQVLGMGGFKPSGAAASIGWLLVGEDVTPRDWAFARRLMVSALGWARCHAIKRVHASPEASMAGAQRLLAALGFEATGREGDHIIMTKELT